MDRYQRVEKPRPETPIDENEIRITGQGKIRNYITYAIKLLRKDKGSTEIIIKAMGTAINKAVTITEIMKRRIPGLHQNVTIGSIDITDSWEPLEEGLLPLETTRPVSSIAVTLSFKELDTNSPGYQPPLPVDQVRPLGEFEAPLPVDQARPLVEFDYDVEGSPSHVRGRGRRNLSYGRGRGRGRRRGRGRGRGRGHASADANLDEGGSRGRGRGRQYKSDGPGQWIMASEFPNVEQANDKGGDAQYRWEVAQEQSQSFQPQANDKGGDAQYRWETEQEQSQSFWPQANDKWGDAQYGWEVAQEQVQDFQPWGGNSEECNYYLQLSDVVVSEEKVIWWVDTIEGLVDATSYFKSAEVKVVGIDCEWKPNFVKGEDPNQISILQIAAGKKVLIFDLIGLFEREPDALDTCLKVVFHSPNILKLGYGFQRDLEQLFESYTDLKCFHFCDGILDLQEVNGTPKGGLPGLTKTVLGRDLNKGKRMSNWEWRPLSRSQLHYAALDAAVLIKIFDILCCEPSSHGTAETQHTSHWKSLVKCCKPYVKKKRESWSALSEN